MPYGTTPRGNTIILTEDGETWRLYFDPAEHAHVWLCVKGAEIKEVFSRDLNLDDLELVIRAATYNQVIEKFPSADPNPERRVGR